MKKKIADGSIVAIIFISLIILAYGISWIATCGVIKLIAMCFGWTFNWLAATGIWLIMCLASTVFKTTVSK